MVSEGRSRAARARNGFLLRWSSWRKGSCRWSGEGDAVREGGGRERDRRGMVTARMGEGGGRREEVKRMLAAGEAAVLGLVAVQLEELVS